MLEEYPERNKCGFHLKTNPRVPRGSKDVCFVEKVIAKAKLQTWHSIPWRSLKKNEQVDRTQYSGVTLPFISERSLDREKKGKEKTITRVCRM
jgi:hypothetical protein